MNLADVTILICIVLVAYTFAGYGLLLRLIAAIVPRKEQVSYSDSEPTVSVIVTAFNEERRIERRIQNLLALDYPPSKLELIVASDGSSDSTVGLASRFEPRITVIAYQDNRGRAAVHNDTVQRTRGEILVFTDADTEFEREFLRQIVKPFEDSSVGAAVGHLSYRAQHLAIGRAEALYWKVEMRLKELENQLGILNNGTGACMAIRRGAFKSLRPVDDVDTATVMDILFSGGRIALASEARADDSPPGTAAAEFRMRIRGTAKTVASVFGRVRLLDWLRHPIVTWSVLSHRGLRYLTPFLMLGALISTLAGARTNPVHAMLLGAQICFYVVAAVGWLLREKTGMSVMTLPYAFVVAMSGMLIGVLKAAAGRAPAAYRPTD